MSVTIVERPRTKGRTAVAEEVLDHFAGLEARLSWQHYTPENISSLYGEGMVPVSIKDFEESEDEEVKALAETVRRAHFVTPEGYIQKRDCILMRQSVGVWQANRDAAEARRVAREAGRSATEKLQQEIERMPGGDRVQITGGFPDTRNLVARASGKK